MKVYLAAAWSRRLEIKAIAERLTALGVEITSRWLDEEVGMELKCSEHFLRDRAYVDLADVDAADAIVRFTDRVTSDTVSKNLISGARMVEFGYAKARGKTLYVVGGKQNVFDNLDGIVHLKDVNELVAVLS